MAQSHRPTLARRSLGRALKRYRIEAKLNRTEAGERISYSRNSIKNIEDGTGGTKPIVIAGLCDAYGVNEEVKSHLCALALDGSKRGWYQKYPDGKLHLQPLYLETEQSATRIRSIETEFIPGLMQTTGYIDEQMTQSRMTDEEIENVRKLRGHRQTLMFGRDHLPTMQFAIGMGALGYLDAMPTAVKEEQINHLVKMSALSEIDIRVVNTVGPTVGAFTILTASVDSGGDETFVYLDGLDGCRYMEDPQIIETYEQPFKVVFEGATPIKEYVE